MLTLRVCRPRSARHPGEARSTFSVHPSPSSVRPLFPCVALAVPLRHRKEGHPQHPLWRKPGKVAILVPAPQDSLCGRHSPPRHGPGPGPGIPSQRCRDVPSPGLIAVAPAAPARQRREAARRQREQRAVARVRLWPPAASVHVAGARAPFRDGLSELEQPPWQAAHRSLPTYNENSHTIRTTHHPSPSRSTVPCLIPTPSTLLRPLFGSNAHVHSDFLPVGPPEGLWCFPPPTRLNNRARSNNSQPTTPHLPKPLTWNRPGVRQAPVRA